MGPHDAILRRFAEAKPTAIEKLEQIVSLAKEAMPGLELQDQLDLWAAMASIDEIAARAQQKSEKVE